MRHCGCGFGIAQSGYAQKRWLGPGEQSADDALRHDARSLESARGDSLTDGSTVDVTRMPTPTHISITQPGLAEAIQRPRVMALWERLRRHRRAASASEIAALCSYGKPEAQVALDLLEQAALVRKRKASRGRRTALYETAVTSISVLVDLRDPVHAEIVHGLERYMKHDLEDAQFRNEAPITSVGRGFWRFHHCSPLLLDASDLRELKQRISRVEEVIRLLNQAHAPYDQQVRIAIEPPIVLPGHCTIPRGAIGIVVFAHGSGSSRHSPRNQAVARYLNDHGLGTLLLDLLTEGESADRRKVFDIELLATRLSKARGWLAAQPRSHRLAVGYFGASTGAAAALVAAAKEPASIAAVVSRGGRPDLAGSALASVRSPTLLIVGGQDVEVLELNRLAQSRLRCTNELSIVPGATHLFEEPGTLKEAAEQACAWFTAYLSPGELGIRAAS